MVITRAKVAQRLRLARGASALSLRAVAKHVGVHAATLSRIEQGKTEVGVELLDRLAAVYGRHPADFYQHRFSVEYHGITHTSYLNDQEVQTMPKPAGSKDTAKRSMSSLLPGNEEARNLGLLSVSTER